MAVKAQVTLASAPERTRWFRLGNNDRLYDIYDYVMSSTDSHEESEEAMCWCELACVGETYETDDVYIEIIDDDDY